LFIFYIFHFKAYRPLKPDCLYFELYCIFPGHPVTRSHPVNRRAMQIKISLFMCILRNRGRTASYPTAPSQIPACGITAPGSSDLLTYALTNIILFDIPRSEVCMVDPAFLIRPIEFPVYASCGSFDGMSILPSHATLGTGGWLNLTRWRLSLYKKRQTCLAHWILIIGHSMLLLRPRSWRPHPAEACRATACRELPSGPRGSSRAGPRVPISGCRRPHVVCL
jgi:hypothetical protein